VGKSDPQKLEDVRSVLHRNKADIIQRYRAEGVAIGKRQPRDESYVIVVYLSSRDKLPAEAVEIEGIPLHFEITGKFKLQKS
jgi:hypothetical protein